MTEDLVGRMKRSQAGQLGMSSSELPNKCPTVVVAWQLRCLNRDCEPAGPSSVPLTKPPPPSSCQPHPAPAGLPHGGMSFHPPHPCVPVILESRCCRCERMVSSKGEPTDGGTHEQPRNAVLVSFGVGTASTHSALPSLIELAPLLPLVFCLHVFPGLSCDVTISALSRALVPAVIPGVPWVWVVQAFRGARRLCAVFPRWQLGTGRPAPAPTRVGTAEQATHQQSRAQHDSYTTPNRPLPPACRHPGRF